MEASRAAVLKDGQATRVTSVTELHDFVLRQVYHYVCITLVSLYVMFNYVLNNLPYCVVVFSLLCLLSI